MGAALIWSFWASQVLGDGLGEGYPESYVLGPPKIRFSDFTDETLASTCPNPYDDPLCIYSPASFVFFRVLSYSDRVSLILVCFFSLAALALLLARVLQSMTPGAWARVSLAFLFLVLSYPVLFCIDRGNIEIVMIPLIGWAIYFYSRHRDVEGTACLFPAICLKFYPAFLLVILLSRRKVGLAVLCGVGAIVVIAACSCFFQASPGVIWASYQQNLDVYRDLYYLNNGPIEGSASPWNAYKIILIALDKMGIIPPVNFSFDGPLIQASYHVYSLALALAALICAGYAWFYERELARGILMLLLFISIAAPSGGDYRLSYAAMALVLLMLLPRQRKGDWTALVLIALAVIPKKEIFLTFAGTTETGYADVPLQALLNPLFIMAAMVILLYQSRHPFDWHRKARYLRDLFLSRWRWI